MSPQQLIAQRRFFARAIEGLSEEQLVEIPVGRSNHILWNVGHVITTHQLLTYRLAGLDLRVPPRYVALFAKGSSPADWRDDVPAIKELEQQLVITAEHFAEDFEAGRFERFERYETSTGIAFERLEDAMAFDHFHEGIHLGIILSIRKQLST